MSPRRFLSFFSETNVPSPFRDSCLAGRPGGAAGAGRGERVFPRSAVGRARPDVPRGRAPITCDIGRVRCTHTMEPPSGGRRFGHPPGGGWEGPRDGCRGALKEERGWEGISRWGRTDPVFCQVVIGQCGVSFPSEKAVGFSPVRNWPVIARVLLFHCIRA